MAWTVVDPKYAMGPDTIVARVDVPVFIDEIDYEGLMDRGVPPENATEFHQKVVVLSNPVAYDKLSQIMGSAFADVPEFTVREELRKLCLERQAVVLKWMAVQ